MRPRDRRRFRDMSQYHRDTAYFRDQIGGYTLDWSQQPRPFKEYLHRDMLSLPEPRPPREGFFAHALGWPPPISAGKDDFDAGDLSAVLLMSAGVTARTTVSLRAPASAGALYPAELYALSCGTDGLEDGLYHFAPQGPGLHLLWPGELSSALARLAGQAPRGLWFVISSIFWRSLWKYRTRALRYCLLDAGHVLANLELSLAVCGLDFDTTLEFPDSSVGVFLGLASEEEAPLVLVGAGWMPEDPGPEDPGLPPLDLQSAPLSQRVGRDRELLQALQQGNLGALAPAPDLPEISPPKAIPPLRAPEPPDTDPPFLEVVRSRRSRRNFMDDPLNLDQLLLLLNAALPARAACRASLLIGPGPDWQPGIYHYHPGQSVLEPVATGEDLRGRAARACLGQLWVGPRGHEPVALGRPGQSGRPLRRQSVPPRHDTGRTRRAKALSGGQRPGAWLLRGGRLLRPGTQPSRTPAARILAALPGGGRPCERAFRKAFPIPGLKTPLHNNSQQVRIVK